MPKILHLDIETAPILADVWGLWKNNVGLNQIRHDWYVLCWAAKWHGEDTTYYDSLIEHKESYKKRPEDDKSILVTLHELMSQADAIVAHNGKGFDLPKLNARFILCGLPPVKPFKVIDTLQIVKKNFRFTSNKLDWLAHILLGDQKRKSVEFQGHDLWSECIKGNRRAWREMIKYNIQDVALLERVWEYLRPWDKQSLNMGLFTDTDAACCSKCGSDNIKKDGFHYTSVSKFQAYRCKDCKGWSRGRKNLLTKEERENLLTNVA
jgi:hypothetical protein